MPHALTAPVGRRSLGAENKEADVKAVQQLLQDAAALLVAEALNPGPIDGSISDPPKKSSTVEAIQAFQKRFLPTPDGLIVPGGRTWRRLVAVRSMGATAHPFFPFPAGPATNWTSGARAFGANRNGASGPRAHAGCDLYFPVNAWIYAIADGVVVRKPYAFYNQTEALEVDHGAFIVRYGEIKPGCTLKTGEAVVGGQKLAQVGHLVPVVSSSDMLHIELYDKTSEGALTVGKAESARHTNGRPFYRRRDLVDPTPWLNRWRSNRPTP